MSQKRMFFFDFDDTLFQTNMTHMACVTFVFFVLLYQADNLETR